MPDRQTSCPGDVVDRVLSGDAAAWETFIGHYERRLIGYFRPRVNDPSLAEDLAQETFVAFWTAVPNFDRDRAVEPFLFTIASNKLTDWLRREGRRPALPLSFPSSTGGGNAPPAAGRAVSSMARSRERRDSEEDALATTLGRLIEKWRADAAWDRIHSIELTVVAGRTNRDAAAVLGLDEQAVANHKSYALRKVREEVARAGVTGKVHGTDAD